jgi:hypothetical protein
MPAQLQYEKHLETWIERDPTLISADIHLVGTQVVLDTGPLDVLGIDNLGRWAVIELKKAKLRRLTVAQALDYAGCLAEMSAANFKQLVGKCLKKRGVALRDFMAQLTLDDSIFEQPDILVYIVGTSQDINLDRISKNTTFQGNPLNIVTFDVYINSDGEHVLLRQLSEADISSPPQSKIRRSKETPKTEQPVDRDARIERLMQLAQSNGVGSQFRKIYELATDFGLYPKTYKWSIMYAPPQNKNRVLICAWVNPKDGLFDVYINTDAFAEFYPINQRKARQIADAPLRYSLTADQTDEFIAIAQKLLNEISRNS